MIVIGVVMLLLLSLLNGRMKKLKVIFEGKLPGREMNRRIKKTFDARGIEIPFPHQTIYWGEPKSGKAPPLYVANMLETA